MAGRVRGKRGGRGSSRLSASCSDGQPSSVDVEVSEVVEGGAQSPAGLHVVHLLGQLSDRQTDRRGEQS